MQIIHVSDTHLGYRQFNLDEREKDIYEAFNEVIDTAVKDKVDAVIHSGDIFDVPRPSGNALYKLTEAIKRLNEHNIRFFFTLGEHDISRVKDTPFPAIFNKLLNMAEYVGDGNIHEYKGVVIRGLPKHRKSEHDTLLSRLKDIEDKVKGYSAKKILVMHQGLHEFHEYAGELSVYDLPKGFDYYAMGHLHDHSCRYLNNMLVCYPGSIDNMRSEGIRDAPRGFCMLDLSSDVNVEFIRIRSARSNLVYEVDYDELEAKVNEIIEHIRVSNYIKEPMVRLKIKGKVGIDNLIISSILSRLDEHCLYYTWDVTSSMQENNMLYMERPDVDKELLKLTEKALGDSATAEFAINELLPMLTDNSIKSVIDAVWERFSENMRKEYDREG